MRFLCSSLTLLMLAIAAPAQNHFVDANIVGGAGDGTSWANAFSDIQSGISAAAVSDEAVWVANGTYIPASLVMQSNVAVIGGFSGSSTGSDGGIDETSVAQRDLVANVANIDLGTTEAVFFPSGTTLNSTLDGFTIDASDSQDSIVISAANSGIMLKNLTIPDLSASFTGSSVIDLFVSSVLLESILVHDDGDFPGAQILTVSQSTAEITNCAFTGIQASGSAVVQAVGSDETTIDLSNSTFDGNVTAIGGGGTNSITIANCIFSNHTGIAVEEDSGGTQDATMNHCLFFNNAMDHLDGGTINVNGAANINALSGSANNIDGDPQYMNAASGDFNLDDFSAAIDQGTNSAGLAFDIAGNARNDNPNVPNGPGGFTDIGAYEGAITLVPVELSVFGVE